MSKALSTQSPLNPLQKQTWHPCQKESKTESETSYNWAKMSYISSKNCPIILYFFPRKVCGHPENMKPNYDRKFKQSKSELGITPLKRIGQIMTSSNVLLLTQLYPREDDWADFGNLGKGHPISLGILRSWLIMIKSPKIFQFDMVTVGKISWHTSMLWSDRFRVIRNGTIACWASW